MIQTQNIHSLTDFQRNAAGHIERLRETGLPEVLTVKGRAELVVQTADAYQALLNRLELFESARAINRGLQEVADGRGIPLEEFKKRIKARGIKVPGGAR
jgi:PHD/YefM family antitoxin component YafN of YafNO toxin-antitoxin module